MQTNPKTYSFSGLIAVLGLLSLLVGLIVMLVLPSIRYAAWVILALGILLLAVAFILDFRRVSGAITGRRGRFGAGATVMASIFIGITLLANAISIGNYQRFDFTGVAQFTLTSQTKDVLAELETPVEILCFFTPDNPVKDYTSRLLNEYQNYTEQLSIETIDPDLHPDQARQYNVAEFAAEYGTVVFKSKGGQRSVFGPEIAVEAEHVFTSAILEVTGIIQKRVYFLTGHGEGDIYSEYSQAREGLLDNLYKVATIDLAYTHEIPEDCAVLIIAGPQRSLASTEITIIEEYLQSGAPALILVNPDSPPELKQLLLPWGVEIEDGIVIDPSSYVDPSKDTLLVPRTRNFLGLPNIYFPGATAIVPQPSYEATPIPGTLAEFVWTSENTEIEMYSLIRSSKDSWLERDFVPGQEPQFDEGVDLQPPLHIGFLIITPSVDEAGEESTEEIKVPRLLIIGDSDFASNKHFVNGNNRDLFLNSVNLLTAGKELISIERKVLPFRRLVVGPEATRFIRISSIALLPLLVLVMAGITWWRRR